MMIPRFGCRASQSGSVATMPTPRPVKSTAAVFGSEPQHLGASDSFELSELGPSKNALAPENDIETEWADLRRMVGKLLPKQVHFEEPTEDISLGWFQTMKINREAFSDLKLARNEVNQGVNALQQDAETYLDGGPAKRNIDSVARAFLSSHGQKEQKIVNRGLTRLLNGTGGASPRTLAKDVKALMQLRRQSIPEIRDLLEVAQEDWEVQADNLLTMDIVKVQQALDDYEQALNQVVS